MTEVLFGGLLVGALVWIVRGRPAPIRLPRRRSPTLDNTAVTFAHRGKQ